MIFRGPSKVILIASILSSLVTSGEAVSDQTVETPRLIVSDMTGMLSQGRLEELAHDADTILLNIYKIWSSKPSIYKFGRIRVEFHHAAKKGARYSTCRWFKESGHFVRTVRVFGVNGQPQQMAHKLTHAVFPNSDKLIRNMMGIHSENRLGNQKSFPMCGFSNDVWVQALLQTDSTIPLDSLGPDHSDWGMEFRNNRPFVRNRAKQHAAYAEAGSFAEYLIRTYGIDNMKKFNRLSRSKERPCNEGFGRSLDILEAGWIHYLKSEFEANANDVLILKRLRKANPNTACFKARSVVPNR
jgi:hypothetical protein